MRGIPLLLLATCWTLVYVFVTQSAIAAELDPAVLHPPAAAAGPVFFGGTLAPVVVEAPAGVPGSAPPGAAAT